MSMPKRDLVCEDKSLLEWYKFSDDELEASGSTEGCCCSDGGENWRILMCTTSACASAN